MQQIDLFICSGAKDRAIDILVDRASGAFVNNGSMKNSYATKDIHLRRRVVIEMKNGVYSGKPCGYSS